ncbi:hypothetical protein DQ384_36500 [Sphaerisporangium album]|uniref:Uncharacterized protein n=1 Tax=Sphaerisporangium album TaxID=509200 RepID=A0A367ETQ6_9ACTN|nr:hypothetical protein [Sphaerisporangium album]RCG21119.1 hypothetical protein DQ384_36500 [Sphaerisporangium album]
MTATTPDEARVCARAFALMQANGAAEEDVAETRRALEGAVVLRRTFAPALGVTPSALVDELLAWLAANPDLVRDRDTYVKADARVQLCRSLGVPVPEKILERKAGALARLLAATGRGKQQLTESLHWLTVLPYRRLVADFLASADEATLEALLGDGLFAVIDRNAANRASGR